MQVLFSENDGARALHFADHLRTRGRDARFVEAAGSGGQSSGRVNQVLKPNRNSVQRPAPVSSQDFFFRARAWASA